MISPSLLVSQLSSKGATSPRRRRRVPCWPRRRRKVARAARHEADGVAGDRGATTEDQVLGAEGEDGRVLDAHAPARGQTVSPARAWPLLHSTGNVTGGGRRRRRRQLHRGRPRRTRLVAYRGGRCCRWCRCPSSYEAACRLRVPPTMVRQRTSPRKPARQRQGRNLPIDADERGIREAILDACRRRIRPGACP